MSTITNADLSQEGEEQTKIMVMKRKGKKKLDSMLIKYKRKREEMSDPKMERVRKRNNPGYLERACQLLANGKADLCDIFNHYESLYIRHSETF
jgi:hypothetical protein